MGYHFNRDDIAPATPVPVQAVPRPQPDAKRVRDWIFIERPERLTVQRIQRLTAEHFVIPLSEMTSACRARDVARPRQVAMYLCEQRLNKSRCDIGRRFGDRDPTTVLHAVRQVAKIRIIDAEFDETVKALEAKL